MRKETYLVAIGPSFINPEILTSWLDVYESPSEEYWNKLHAFDEDMKFMYTYEKTWDNGWELVK